MLLSYYNWRCLCHRRIQIWIILGRLTLWHDYWIRLFDDLHIGIHVVMIVDINWYDYLGQCVAQLGTSFELTLYVVLALKTV